MRCEELHKTLFESNLEFCNSHVLLVGLAGFEPTTSTQEPRNAVPYGFLYDRSRTSSSPKRVEGTVEMSNLHFQN
jgi:hypothetical protein